MAEELKFRFATESDVPWLAKMNQELILDEGHRNKMTLPELEQRMSDFLQNEYDAVIVVIFKADFHNKVNETQRLRPKIYRMAEK